jgi:hypothetical protein
MEIFDTTEINLENTAPYICKHAGWVTGLWGAKMDWRRGETGIKFNED